MEDKDTNHYDTSKIMVDFYHPQRNGNFVCSCYTIGVPATIEHEYLVKTVTHNELKKMVADGFGNVNVSFFPDESRYITFEKYLQGLDENAIAIYCTEVINRREFRDHLFNPSAYHKAHSFAA